LRAYFSQILLNFRLALASSIELAQALPCAQLSLTHEGIDPALFTTDPFSIVNDPEIDLIVEVMGGIEPARELIMMAIDNRKSIVTANKALLASHGADLFTAAYAQG
jgi:homoserine dehydrogenase